MTTTFDHGLRPSNTPSWNSGGTADVLPEERKRASFPVEKMTNFLDGGADRTKKRRWIVGQTEGEEFNYKGEASREEQLGRHLKSFIGIHKEFAEKGYVPQRYEVAWMSANSVFKGSLMNHLGLWLPTILGQGSPEQMMYWAPKTLMHQIIGAYAQTELGHGSNVRGLQTIAVYDKTTQQFVLNTPTLTSMKWWPGTLGKVATHAAVFAQLAIDGKQYGVHCFIVQLRDENHNPLPGIEVGDLGAKLADGANDTGFLRMKDVRIPREHMLMKGQIVTPEGKYLRTLAKKENPVMHYSTMLSARAGMMAASGGILAAGATIATRYSLVRRQGFQDTSSLDYRSVETKILDYGVQRYRVLKEVALAYAIQLTGNWLSEKVEVLSGDTTSKEIVDALPEIHASAAGLKALCTLQVHESLENLRKCCGGNGYLLSSGISMLVQDFAWQVTAEGDVIILLLQTARFLMKSLEQAKRGEQLAGLVKSLEPLKDPSFNVSRMAPARAKSPRDFKDGAYLESLFRYRAMNAIVACGEELEAYRKRGLSQDDAWNAAALNLATTAKSHCFYFMLAQMNNQITKAESELKDPLRRLAALYACSQILEGQQWLGILDATEAKYLQSATSELLAELRPDACALVDAFDIPDRVLNSTIGRKDGNVYEALFQAAKKSTLNKSEVFEGYAEHLRPHLDLELLKNNSNKEPFGDIWVDEKKCEVGEPLAKL